MSADRQDTEKAFREAAVKAAGVLGKDFHRMFRFGKSKEWFQFLRRNVKPRTQAEFLRRMFGTKGLDLPAPNRLAEVFVGINNPSAQSASLPNPKITDLAQKFISASNRESIVRVVRDPREIPEDSHTCP